MGKRSVEDDPYKLDYVPGQYKMCERTVERYLGH